MDERTTTDALCSSSLGYSHLEGRADWQWLSEPYRTGSARRIGWYDTDHGAPGWPSFAETFVTLGLEEAISECSTPVITGAAGGYLRARRSFGRQTPTGEAPPWV